MNYTFDKLGYVGRLGNQMFQIAWAYTQALRSGGKAFVRPDWEYREFFSLPESMYDLPSGKTVDGGTEYYQDITLWHGLDNEVRSIFQPSAIAVGMVKQYVNDDYDRENGCSVHYRRGDYLKHPKHFPVPTERYYISAMKSVVEKNPNTVFYVFSDDINAIRKEYKGNRAYREFSDRVVFFEGTVTPVEVEDRKEVPEDWLDLFAMSWCSNHIIANSTFSWWGGFLSDNEEVIFPSKWFGTDPAVRKIPWRLMIPQTWEEFQC